MKISITPRPEISRIFQRQEEVSLSDLPHCADVTRKYCQKYCGILLIDGKFVKIKGYECKFPVFYRVDYQMHDIPSCKLGKSEDLPLLSKVFTSLKLLNYPFQAVVCDDNQAIRFCIPPCIVIPDLIRNLYKSNLHSNSVGIICLRQCGDCHRHIYMFATTSHPVIVAKFTRR